MTAFITFSILAIAVALIVVRKRKAKVPSAPATGGIGKPGTDNVVQAR